MEKYAGKKAVVIGGTIGMGLATVKELLAGGAEVLLTGRNEEHIKVARDELGLRALKRHGTVEEVAQAVLYLAFDATFTTGSTLFVDGGLAQGLTRPRQEG